MKWTKARKLAWQRMDRFRRKILNICLSCKEPKINKSYCYKCLILVKERERAYKKIRYRIRKNMGLCLIFGCIKPPITTSLCKEHTEKRRQYKKICRMRKRALTKQRRGEII